MYEPKMEEITAAWREKGIIIVVCTLEQILTERSNQGERDVRVMEHSEKIINRYKIFIVN
jgi:hypothetical protein